MTARVLMLQGASSSVGKSTLVTALCRVFARRGVRVAPFKAQNMSNNAAVCADGAEIGRSQALQALAAGVQPTAAMNPILLKPEGNARAQVIAMGRPWRRLEAGTYSQHRADLWPLVTTALDHLRSAYDLVLIEGAGSPAELNLQAGDIVNMAVARYAEAPVILVGDIDRGGVFAQLLGTVWLLAPKDRALLQGLVVNKFRGELALFADGVRMLETRSALPVLGVVPFIPNLHLPEEDATALDAPSQTVRQDTRTIDIAVIRLPHIANFDDFDPLAVEPGVNLRYVDSCITLGQPHAVILPGTKSTISDLMWLRERGLDRALQALAAKGTAVVGICGGYQMLGRCIRDPERVESLQPAVPGLDLLSMDTLFAPAKATHQVEARIRGGPAWLAPLTGQTLQGYEIHMGHSTVHQPWIEIVRRSGATVAVADGAIDATGKVWGCYLHGLFANQPLRRAWLVSLGWCDDVAPRRAPAGVHEALDLLASQVEASVDMPRLEAIIWGN